MISILSTRRFALWTRELRRWLSAKFDSISIDLTPVEEKLDDVKSDVADVKTAVENIDFSTLAKEQTLTTGLQTVLTALYPKATTEQLTTATQQILAAIGNIDFSTVAKQGSNPNATNTAILAAFGNIDFSTLAKQGTNSAATNTAILAAFNNIDFSSLATLSGQQAAAADLAILKQRIGESTDTASAQTLFGKIANLLAAITQSSGDPLLRQFFDITGAFTAEEVTEQEAIDVQQEVLDDVWPDCPVGSGGSAAYAARRNWADDTEADVRYYNSTIGLQCSPIPVNGPVVYNGYRFYPDGTYESIE